jgi:predicted ATPase/class 3 adenylate cyclase
MADLPSGTVTFLFTDVEGSTRLWERHPEQMRAALAEHDALIESLTAQHGGLVVRPRGEGDSRFCVFRRATDAVAAAAAIQRALHQQDWPPEAPLRVRLALHTGEADLRDGDYYGGAVNRAARLRAIAHGGQTLLSAAVQELVRDGLPGGVGLRDLGDHRLSDLARPERVYQLLAPGVLDQFPPLRTPDALPHNLPLQVTSFVGREREVAEVREALAAYRLVTLTGPGGVGKTRLALEAAAGLLEVYPDGVWLVDLAPLADGALVPQAVAAAVGVREAPGRPLLATLTDALRPKRVLLVLDNCEHLVEACARSAEALLRGCPQVRILATSREPLGLAGERPRRIPSLALPDTRRLPSPEGLGAYEAVRLFAERASTVQPRFAVTEQNARAVAEICQRLDGIPLALELAAARVRVLPVEQLLGRLEDRFAVLTGGGRTALPRQQTLRASVDWSYDLLTGQERMLFARLAVFAGGWTLEAAEAVGAGDGIGADGVLELLTGLADRSLVVVEEQPDGTARYRLLETLRQYAARKLAARAGAVAAVRERHAACYLDLAARVAARAGAGAPAGATAAALDALAPEHENLRAALRWYRDGGRAGESLALAGALSAFWWRGGHLTEGRDWLGAALALPGAGAHPAPRAWAAHEAGLFLWSLGELAAADARSAESLALCRALGDRPGEARALHQLGHVAFDRGDYAAAGGRFAEDLALSRDLGDRGQIANALYGLGDVAYAQGDPATARTRYEESLAAARRAGPGRPEEAMALRRLGVLAEDAGDHTTARERYVASAALIRDAGTSWAVPAALEGLAGVAAATGAPARALRLAAAAERLRQAMGTPRPPADEARLQPRLAQARDALSHKAHATAWAEGQAMAPEQAVAYALDDAGGPAGA